jgi:hypothetical protein
MQVATVFRKKTGILHRKALALAYPLVPGMEGLSTVSGETGGRKVLRMIFPSPPIAFPEIDLNPY